MRSALLTALLAGAVALVFLCLPAAALTASPVTLTSPAQNAVIARGQPRFSGTAGNGFADGPTIHVLVYSGATPTGTPLQTLTTARSGTSFSVGLRSPLPDGQYTADAQQDNAAGLFGAPSPSHTFIVHNALPQITLDATGPAPFLGSMPTLSGTAGTAFGDAGTVGLVVYPGADTSHAPVEFLASARSSGGEFTIQISPGLPDGQYTALANQQGVAGAGTSLPQTFRIKADAPAVTLENPAPGASTTDVEPLFSGGAGDVVGDSAQVTIALYSGVGTDGQPIETVNVTTTGSSWSVRWPTPLGLGQYTAQATQSDDVGHTGISAPSTFQIGAAPNVIGSSVKLSHGTVSVAVRCGLATGEDCAGDVLILTVRKFRPVHEGPVGRLRLMFAYVTIAGHRTAMVSRHVPGLLARALRRAGKINVKVSTALSAPGGSPKAVSAIRRLR